MNNKHQIQNFKFVSLNLTYMMASQFSRLALYKLNRNYSNTEAIVFRTNPRTCSE